MKVAVIGLGYVGVTAAACLAASGHEVVGVDVNASKVEMIQEGYSPISEPGIEDLVKSAVVDGRLRAVQATPDLSDFDLVIVCVGTPSASDGSHNMSFVAESARQIAAGLRLEAEKQVTVAFRSTFRPGTMKNLIAPIFERSIGPNYRERVELVYNPEFLRESCAIADFNAPPKIVIGTEVGHGSATMDLLHASLDAPVFNLRFGEAELTKFVDNTWHALKVGFANEIGRMCTSLEISAEDVHRVFVSDTKLNISPYYLRPGGPFGGSCLPKDLRALVHIAKNAGSSARIIDSIIDSNVAHKKFQLERVTANVPPRARILVAGLSFKAGTDDLRESPHVDLVRDLLDMGYKVDVYEPTLRSDTLVGQNLGYTLSHFPEFSDCLSSRSEIETREYDAFVKTNATADGLVVEAQMVIDLGAIP